MQSLGWSCSSCPGLPGASCPGPQQPPPSWCLPPTGTGWQVWGSRPCSSGIPRGRNHPILAQEECPIPRTFLLALLAGDIVASPSRLAQSLYITFLAASWSSEVLTPFLRPEWDSPGLMALLQFKTVPFVFCFLSNFRSVDLAGASAPLWTAEQCVHDQAYCTARFPEPRDKCKILQAASEDPLNLGISVKQCKIQWKTHGHHL